jgi:hypothetical protein
MTGVGLFLTAAAVLAPAHNTPDGVVLRAVQVVVRSEAIEIRYQLGLHDNMIQRELRALAGPGADTPTDPAEAVARYRDAIVLLLPKKMRVTLDAKPVTMAVHRADIVRQPHRQLEISYHIPFTPTLTPVKFVLWDDNFQGVPGYHFAAMRARGDAQVLPIGDDKPLDRLPSVPEPGQASAVPLEPMRGIAAYVCLAGATAPTTTRSAPAPVEDDKGRTKPVPPKVTDAKTPPPAEATASPAAGSSQQKVFWSLGCGVAAVLIAAAWWWTSRKERKEKS